MKLTLKSAVAALVLAAGLSVSLAAQAAAVTRDGPEVLRRIDVTGSAEIRVTPDQAVISLGVESWAPALAAARRDNDERMARLLKLADKLGIDKQSVQTDYLSVEPVYGQDGGGTVTSIASYRVRKNLSVTLNDLSRLDGVLTEFLNAGANRLDGVAFQLRDPRPHRDQARQLAVRAARDKAAALAGELGQKIGKPLAVNELGGNPQPVYAKAMAQNLSMDFAGPSGGGSTVAIGQIVVDAQVAVGFQLVD